jgi:hypothetical protein
VRALAASAAIRNLELQGLQGVTDEGMRCLQAGATGTGLVSLNLCLCRKVTDQGIAAVAKMAALESLNLECCAKVTNAALLALAHSSLKLLHLGVGTPPTCAITLDGIAAANLPDRIKVHDWGDPMDSEVLREKIREQEGEAERFWASLRAGAR